MISIICCILLCASLNGSVVQKKELSYLDLLPKPIYERVLTFVEKDFIYKYGKIRHQILPDKRELRIDARGSLVLISESKKKSSCIIKSAQQKNAERFGKKRSTPSQVNFFTLSPDQKNLAVLVDNVLIKIFTIGKKIEQSSCYNLENYFKKEGCLGYTTHDFEYKLRGYMEVPEKNCHNTELGDGLPWHNPVRLMALSSNKRLVFANDYQIFLVNKEGDTYKKIYEDILTRLGPFSMWNGERRVYTFYSGNFVNVAFNIMGTRLTLVRNMLCSLLENEKKEYEAGRLYKDDGEIERCFKIRLLKTLCNNASGTIEQLEAEPEHFDQKLAQLIEPKVVKRLNTISIPHSVDMFNPIETLMLPPDY